MDSERITEYDDLKYSARVCSYYFRQKPERIFCVFLTLLYVLILALFITVVSRSKSDNALLVGKKEIIDFHTKVSSLSVEMEKLEATIKGKTCDATWIKFENSCYFLGRSKTDWQAARTFCQSKESDLVVINGEKEQMFLTGKASPSRYNRFWIGLHDIHEEGKWQWVDGTDFSTSLKFWSQGEPNDADDEDCAHMWYDGEWNDVPCDYDHCYALCEKAL